MFISVHLQLVFYSICIINSRFLYHFLSVFFKVTLNVLKVTTLPVLVVWTGSGGLVASGHKSFLQPPVADMAPVCLIGSCYHR